MVLVYIEFIELLQLCKHTGRFEYIEINLISVMKILNYKKYEPFYSYIQASTIIK